VIPAEVGWSDIGSWGAVHGLLLDKNSTDGKCSSRRATLWTRAAISSLVLEKSAALIGVHDLIVVDTPDALLVCPRDPRAGRRQNVKWLKNKS